MGLILRQQSTDTNASGISVKGSALSYAEGDSNFIYLLTNMSGSNLSLTGNATITGTLTVNGNIGGNLVGTSTTASYIKLAQGPGIIINSSNPLAISASVVTVNGSYPTSNGNVAVSITQTVTGTSASLAAYPTSPSTPDGLTWIVANDPTPAKNGNTYIWSSGSAAWYQIANAGQTSNDARYLMLTPQQPLSGTLNMDGYGITNAGTYQGTASWASNVNGTIFVF
jgi:hypothetical protein